MAIGGLCAPGNRVCMAMNQLCAAADGVCTADGGLCNGDFSASGIATCSTPVKRPALSSCVIL